MTTYSDTAHGRLIKCNDITILCNTEEWLVDGSVNMRDSTFTTTTYTDASITSTSYNDIAYS